MDIRKWRSGQRNKTLLILLFLNQNVIAQSFTLNGSIDGKDTGYAILLYFRDAIKQRRADTVLIKEGKFQFTGDVTGAEFAELTTDPVYNSGNKKYNTAFFIEPGYINISFRDGEANKAVISGSKIQKEYDTLRKYTNQETLELQQLSASYTSIDSLLKNALIDPKTAEVKQKEVDKLYNPILRSKSNKELSYITKHPNSYVSLLMVYTFVGRLPNDSIDVMYSTLSDAIKGSTLDNRFLAYNARVRKAMADEYPFDKLRMNEKAPSFKIYNISTNDSLMVDDFKGKVVILEFWGLYCVPCLKGNPYFEELLKKHGGNSLKIVGININKEREVPELVSYIKKNKFSKWIHVSVDAGVKQQDNLILKGDFSNYVGLGVPRTIVIDKYGNVVYKNYGYSEGDRQKLESIIDIAINKN